jgi:glutamate formiminotransferase
LVAFNVFLTTEDVKVAQAIARQVRASNGGMQGVRALGMHVAGRAQVSMNLITPRQVGPTPVVARIRELATAHGTAVAYSELVGLIPQAATVGWQTWGLRPPLTDDRVLERALGIAPL